MIWKNKYEFKFTCFLLEPLFINIYFIIFNKYHVVYNNIT